MFYARFGQTNGPTLGRTVEPYVLAKIVNPSPPRTRHDSPYPGNPPCENTVWDSFY